jgi:C_GCAxxG_C_C family probable redox protein
MIKMKQLQSIETFKNGYNCAQSVLSVFANDLGLSKDTSMKLASPFGSGIAYMQETCGAVTGALMAIGLKYGKGEHGTVEDKERAYDMSRHFIAEFKKEYGTVSCRKLMNDLDMNTPEGMAKIKELDLFRLHCVKHVQTAVEITNSIINRAK